MSEKAKVMSRPESLSFFMFLRTSVEDLAASFAAQRGKDMTPMERQVRLCNLVRKHRDIAFQGGVTQRGNYERKDYAAMAGYEEKLDLIEDEIMHLMRDGAEAPKAVTK